MQTIQHVGHVIGLQSLMIELGFCPDHTTSRATCDEMQLYSIATFQHLILPQAVLDEVKFSAP